MQFSLHHWDDNKRKMLLGNFDDLLPITELINISDKFKYECERNLYFNYIALGNETDDDIKNIYNIVKHGHITVSVLCSKNKEKADPTPAKRLLSKLLDINMSS